MTTPIHSSERSSAPRYPLRKRKFLLHCLLQSAALLASGGALAADDTFSITASARERYDSNLFRLPDGINPFGVQRRSSTTQTYAVGLRADKTYGLQRFDLTATATRDQYEPYGYLDATGRTLNASWFWTLTPEVTGNISLNQVVAPNNFSDTGFQTQANTRKTEERRFEVDLRPGAALHPRLSLLQTIDKSQQVTFERQNSKTTSLEGGLVYELASANTTELYFRRGRGNYVDINADPSSQTDSQFDEHETGLGLHWQFSGLTSLDGRIGYLDRRHRTFASRNFSGPVGQLAFVYNLTGKTQLQVSATRSLSSIQNNFSSYSHDTSINAGPTWFATGKITVRPSYGVTRRSFGGALFPVAQNLQMFQRDINLQVDWAVYRSIDLSLLVTKSQRSANDRTYQFSDRAASLNAQLRF